MDLVKQEAFQRKMLDALNGAALALMTSIGHRTGLFDVMSRMWPSTSHAIAAAAGLHERYVREWLAALVTAGVVEFDPASSTYTLPTEHAIHLTRASRPDNLAATCQWIAVLGSVEERMVECFERGGGVPHEAYARFHASATDECDETLAGYLISAVLPLVEGLTESLRRGIDLLDVRSGRGRVLNRLANAFPRSRFTGFDVHPEAVEAARADARALGLANVRFELRDAGEHDFASHFDCVTAFDTIHDQKHPDCVLRHVSNALRPDGVFLMREIQATSHVHEDVMNPLAPFLYTISCLHCVTVSLSEDGMALGAMWGAERARRMLAEAGFGQVALHQLTGDAVYSYFTARK